MPVTFTISKEEEEKWKRAASNKVYYFYGDCLNWFLTGHDRQYDKGQRDQFVEDVLTYAKAVGKIQTVRQGHDAIDAMFAKARELLGSGNEFMQTLCLDYLIPADLNYIRHLLKQRTMLGSPDLPRRRDIKRLFRDDYVFELRKRMPWNWEEFIGGVHGFDSDSPGALFGEIKEAVEMLQYKLRRIECVHDFWMALLNTYPTERAKALAQLSAKRKELGATDTTYHKAVGKIQSEYCQELNNRSQGSSKERRKAAELTRTEKLKRARLQLQTDKARLEREIEERKREIVTRINARIAEYTRKLEAGPSGTVIDRAEMRAKLELAGCALLPFPCPMGGVFPSHDYYVLSSEAPASVRNEALILHANALVRKYEFMVKDRRLLNATDGCLCIMFAEEQTQDGATCIYVPFFGVSGGPRPDIFKPEQYLKKLGVPPIQEEARGFAGTRLIGRYFKLFDFYYTRRKLGLKLPSKQAMLSYMQYMTTDWLSESELHKHISQIESWNSIQCAEPTAIMAAAQLYYRMADMELSVPFEATKDLEFSDHSGVHWGKETCGRCAISELSFAGVLESGTRKVVNMTSVIMKMADLERSFSRTLGSDLRRNYSPSILAYPPEKQRAQFQTMSFFHALGIAQSSHNPFWMAREKAPQKLRVSSGNSVPAFVKQLGLEGLFYTDTGEHDRRFELDVKAAFSRLLKDAAARLEVVTSLLKKESLSSEKAMKLALEMSALEQVTESENVRQAYCALRSLWDSFELSKIRESEMFYYVLSTIDGLSPKSSESQEPVWVRSTQAALWKLVGGFQLTQWHVDMLTTNPHEFLDDRIIDACLAVVENRRANVHRRYDVPVGLLVGTNRWVPTEDLRGIRGGGTATVEVQVINQGGNHWIVAVRFPQESAIRAWVYDPLQPGGVSEAIQTQVRRCFNLGNEGSVDLLNGPRQPGGYECGAYVCAAIEALTRTDRTPAKARTDLQNAVFNNDTIRASLYQWINVGE